LLHAPEVECIGKGKAHRPYEFGAKVSGATPINRCKGGQFVAHIAALPGSLCDGHTLGKVIPAIEAQIGGGITRIVADSRLPRSQCSQRLSAESLHLGSKAQRHSSDQTRPAPTLSGRTRHGHLKAEYRMDRNYLSHRTGDAINAVLAQPSGHSPPGFTSRT